MGIIRTVIKWTLIGIGFLVILVIFSDENFENKENVNPTLEAEISSKYWPSDQWPLSVTTGELRCFEGSNLVFINQNTEYAVNGTATARGYEDIDSIWKAPPPMIVDGTNYAPPKMSMVLLEELDNVCSSGLPLIVGVRADD